MPYWPMLWCLQWATEFNSDTSCVAGLNGMVGHAHTAIIITAGGGDNVFFSKEE
jgi:hypothetical protein